jgi:hypothetical protein
MEIRRSEELAGLVRGLYAAMGSGDADAQDVRPYWERAGNRLTPAEGAATPTQTPWQDPPGRRLGRCIVDPWPRASWSWTSLVER